MQKFQGWKTWLLKLFNDPIDESQCDKYIVVLLGTYLSAAIITGTGFIRIKNWVTLNILKSTKEIKFIMACYFK